MKDTPDPGRNEGKDGAREGMTPPPRSSLSMTDAGHPVLMFSFRADVSSSEQDGILDRIKHWIGVTSVARLSPNSKSPEMRRFAYVYLAHDVSPGRVLSDLRRLPEVEEIEAPAARQLL